MPSSPRRPAILSIPERASGLSRLKWASNLDDCIDRLDVTPIQFAETLFEAFRWIEWYARYCSIDEGGLVYSLVLAMRCVATGMPIVPHPDILMLSTMIIACKLHYDDAFSTLDVARTIGEDVSALVGGEAYVFNWLFTRSSLFVDRESYLHTSHALRRMRCFEVEDEVPHSKPIPIRKPAYAMAQACN